jgi:WD40 repeat protein
MVVQVYAKLAGAHKGAVTGMLPLGSKEPAGPDRLITAAADGTVAVWEPSLATPSNVHAPVATWKAHDGPVSSLTFFRHLTKTPEQPQLRLATSGADAAVSHAVDDAHTLRHPGAVTSIRLSHSL